jgi:endo-1,4-beta-xylanase
MIACLTVLAAGCARQIPAQIPAEAQPYATPLFGSALSVDGPPEDMSSSAIPDGVRLVVNRAGETVYTVQVQTDDSHVPVHAGDVLFVTFESRSTTPGGGLWMMHAQHSSAPWTGYFNAEAMPGPDWRRFNIKWTSDKEIPAGSMGITFHVASQPQELEFRGFTAVNLGHYRGALPFTPITYAGREPDAPWRKEAEARIDRYRKANLTVRVVDAQGKPVAGAPVHIRQLRHAYEFGSFVEAPLLWKNEDGNKYREWFLRAYDKATTPMYWADWGWENPDEHARYMQYPVWLTEHDIRIKAHVLIYPGWDYMPARVKQYANDPDGLWKIMEQHIREKLAAVKPFGFVSWDVVNETRDLKDLPNTFGSEDIYVRLYKLAHAGDPGPRLFLNENTILTEGGKTETQQAEFERMIRYLLSHGAPLGGIGMQAHFGDTLTPPTEIWRIVDRFAKFGLPIQITEFDLPIQDEQAQADYTRDLLTAWFAHPATTGFTMWGFWEGSMWQPAAALVSRNWTVRPNGQAWLDLVRKRWWTDTTVVSDAKGAATARVFKGDYEISVADTAQRRSVLGDVDVKLKR